ncbi:hypothetical protein [Methylophaga sp.]|uniref:hypothetical protein n=1 Tax=Methylophaga sp. TaxID=2024840 RepID=UPI003F69A9C6
MKHLVRLVQLVIVLAILYPIYYVWDTDRIDNFCESIKPGMKVSALQTLAEESHLNLNAPDDSQRTGQWMTSVESTASISGYACVIRGAVDSVATAQIVRSE